MDGQTLMLDVAQQPTDIKRWQEAMVDWANDKIEIISTYPDRLIHHGLELQMPAVARFLHNVKQRKHGVKFSRTSVYIRDKGMCQFCGQPVPRADLTYDHVVPRARGGRTTWNNVVVCCFACNQRKAGRTPEQAGMHLRSEPQRPRYLPPKPDRRFLWHPGLPDQWRGYCLTADDVSAQPFWYQELLAYRH